MKRKHESTTIHVTEPCDEWLSTRNKHKIKPPSPKPKRRKSNVTRGFPRQSSSSLWHLTQSAPPHPLLFTATKQSTIQGFFKPAQNKQDKGDISEKRYEEADEVKQVEEILNSSAEPECDSDSGVLEFDPVLASTEKIVPDHAKVSQFYETEKNPPVRPSQFREVRCSREITLEALDEAPDSLPGTVVEHMSPTIDFSTVKPKEPGNSQESVLTTRKTPRHGSHLSILRDSDSAKSFDIDENSISFNKKKKSPISLLRNITKSPDDSLVFTQDDSWDNRLLKNINNRRYGKSSACEVLNKSSTDESLDFIDNSLTFTETLSHNTESHKRRPSLLKIQSLMDDQVSDSNLKIIDAFGQQRTNKTNKTLAADRVSDILEERFHNTGKTVQTGINSLRSRLATLSETHCIKTQPLTSPTDSENDVALDTDGFRRSLLQDKFNVKQADHYHNCLEHPASQLTLSDDVNSLDLSQSELWPRGTITTRSGKAQRPSWLARLRENGKMSSGQNGKHVIENMKFDKSSCAMGISLDDADDELLLNSNTLVHECVSKNVNVCYKGDKDSCGDIDNSLMFTPSQI